jgi:DNA polymerase III delta subunit
MHNGSMLYLIYGNERKATLAKKKELLEMLQKKRPEAEVFTLEPDTFTFSKLESLSSSQGLFEQKHIVILDGILSQKNNKEGIGDLFKNISESSSIFLFLDKELDTKTVSLVEKYAVKTYLFGEKKKTEWGNNTLFSIADAFGEKDKKKAWVLFRKALMSGSSAEEIHGTLFWQIKTILLAKKTKNPEDAGMKSFPFNKATRFAKNFSEKELQEILSRLVDMYHSIRIDGGELEMELEKFLLEIE